MSVGQVGWKWLSVAKDFWWRIFWGGRIHPQNWKVGLKNGSETEYVANFRVAPDSHYSADISNPAKVAGAFPAAQGWNIVAWWFGKGNPLQALHDVGGLLEGPWDRQTFGRFRKVKWHNPTNVFVAQTNSQAVSIRYIQFSVCAWPCEDAKGEPAPDTNDGVMYVITEVAQYSLKDSEVQKTTAGWLGGRWEFGSRISILQ